METKRLLIPYVSQNGPGAMYGIGDCGIAEVVALARALGNQTITVDEAGRLAGLPAGYTWAHITEHVQAVARTLGIALEWRGHLVAEDIREEIRRNRPVIVLVWYPSLPKRRLAGYLDNHFITVHGFSGDVFYYDDPEWHTAADGENIEISAGALEQAMNQIRGQVPGQGLLLRGQELPGRQIVAPPVVGPGILARMRELGDVPISDELYGYPHGSTAFGKEYRYEWVEAAGQVVVTKRA